MSARVWKIRARIFWAHHGTPIRALFQKAAHGILRRTGARNCDFSGMNVTGMIVKPDCLAEAHLAGHSGVVGAPSPWQRVAMSLLRWGGGAEGRDFRDVNMQGAVFAETQVKQGLRVQSAEGIHHFAGVHQEPGPPRIIVAEVRCGLRGACPLPAPSLS